MKKTILKSAIAAASAAALSSGALAWDSLSELGGQATSGTMYWEMHSFSRGPILGPGYPCVFPVCIAGAFNQSSAIFINKSVGGSSVEDTYTGNECNDPDQRVAILDASGNQVTDDSGNGLFSQQGVAGGLFDAVTNTVSFGPGDFVDGPGDANIQAANSGVVGLINCEVVVSPSGKISSQKYSAAANVLGTSYYTFSFQDFTQPIDQQIEVSFEAGDGINPLPLSAWDDLTDGTVDVTDPAALAAWGAAAPQNFTQMLAVSQMTYLTCDARDITSGLCNAVAKSVPVPALAAAMLGLGLAGITYVTGRRRSIK